MTLKLFPQMKLRTLWAYMLILMKTKTFLIYSGTYRLQIAADGTSSRTVITLLGVSDLSKILLEKKQLIISKH